MEDEITSNKVLAGVQRLLVEQTAKGLRKYGHTVRSEALPTFAWIEHTQQELVDALVYLEALKHQLKGD